MLNNRETWAWPFLFQLSFSSRLWGVSRINIWYAWKLSSLDIKLIQKTTAPPSSLLSIYWILSANRKIICSGEKTFPMKITSFSLVSLVSLCSIFIGIPWLAVFLGFVFFILGQPLYIRYQKDQASVNRKLMIVFIPKNHDSRESLLNSLPKAG